MHEPPTIQVRELSAWIFCHFFRSPVGDTGTAPVPCTFPLQRREPESGPVAKDLKLSVVIDVGHGPAAQQQAEHTQRLLLDGCGARLDSIRLAAPRLVPHACRAAVAEEPGVFVIVGGPRAARNAGQIAYERGIPVLFLPGFRTPMWARHLWRRLSLEDMISALARGDMKPTWLSASMAGGQIFFDHASCGLLPLAAEMRRAIAEADIFPEVWKTLRRVGRLLPVVARPSIRFRSDGSPPRSATALMVSAAEREREDTPLPSFGCEAWKHSVFEHLGALASSSFGADWRRSGHLERFICTRLTIDQKRATWLLLDGVPRPFDGPVDFKFVPDAIRTFVFNPRRAANDNSASRPLRDNGRRQPGSQGTFKHAVTFSTPRPAVAR
jgi:hypothetical protein